MWNTLDTRAKLTISSILSLFKPRQAHRIADIASTYTGEPDGGAHEHIANRKHLKMIAMDRFFDFNDNSLVDN